MFRRVLPAAFGAGALIGAALLSPAQAQTAAILPFTNRTPAPHTAVDAPDSGPAAATAPASAERSSVAPGVPDPSAPAAVSNLDWIGESIAETLRDSLSARGILTIGREDTEAAYRRLNLHPRASLSAASVMKIGEAVDAEDVVYGSFEWKANAGGGAAAA